MRGSSYRGVGQSQGSGPGTNHVPVARMSLGALGRGVKGTEPVGRDQQSLRALANQTEVGFLPPTLTKSGGVPGHDEGESSRGGPQASEGGRNGPRRAVGQELSHSDVRERESGVRDGSGGTITVAAHPR